MDLSGFTYGQLIFYAGEILITVGVIAIITGILVFSAKRKSLKRQLMDKYGF